MQQIDKKIEIEKNDKIKTIQSISNDNAKQNNSENLNEEQSSETSQQFYKFEEKLRKKNLKKKSIKTIIMKTYLMKIRNQLNWIKKKKLTQFNLNVSSEFHGN